MKQNQPTSSLAGFRHRALTLSIAVALPVGATAEEDIQQLPTSQATAQTENSYKVDQSTSIKYTQPILDTAKTLTVLSPSVLKDRNVDSLQEALRNVPGISMAAGEGGTPTGDSMSIRGFDARNNISIDGVRDIAGYSRDIYNVEAVEVAKGPGSAVYGRGAAGGSINLQSKTASWGDFNDISARAGSESDYRIKLDANNQVGETTALRVNLLTDDGKVAGRQAVKNSKNAIALSLATGLGTDSRFSLNAEHQKQDNLPDYGLPWVSNGSDPVAELASSEGSAPPVDFSNFYGNIYRDFEKIKAQSVTAKYEKDLSKSTTVRTLARVGTVERQSIVTAPRFINLSDSTDVRMSDEKTRDTRDSLAVIQLDVIGNYRIGAIDHSLVAGIEVAKEKFDRWNYVDVIDDNLDSTPVLNDLYNPNPNLVYTGRYARTDKSDESSGDTTAFYVFDTLTLSSQWQVSLGLRHDTFETEYFYDLDGSDPTAKLDAKEKELSWNAGVVYKPATNGSIYFSSGTSFSPSAADLTASSLGNDASLDPEQTMSYELGSKWEFYDKRLFTSAAVFRTEKNHARTDAADGVFADDDDRFDTLNGRQRVDGLELGAAGTVNEQLSVNVAYTYQHSEVMAAEADDAAQKGHELPRTPAHSFSLWGRYEVSDKLAFGVGAQYVGARYNSSNPASREIADAYVIYDVMASYQVNDNWGVQFNGSNLSDEKYIDQLGGGHAIPGEGRLLSLSTRYAF